MGIRDPRIDAYIHGSAEFAQPILKQFRKAVHAACPGSEETLKWGMPHFDYKGPMCGMAAFKEHCAFSFWKGKLIFGERPWVVKEEAMGHFGRVTCLADLPDEKTLTAYIREAARLNEEGVQVSKAVPPKKTKLIVPDALMAALRKNRKAFATFEGFSPSHRREYVDWITEAKREETRAQRIRTAVEWMEAGKARHWKYR